MAKRRFWGGLTLQARGGGPGLVASLQRAAGTGRDRGPSTRAARCGCGWKAERFGASTWRGPSGFPYPAGRRRPCWPAAVSRRTASGGRQYLGEGWEAAKVRGSRFNEGCSIRMALEAGGRARRAMERLSRGRLGPERAPRWATSRFGTATRNTAIRSASSSTRAGERFLDEGRPTFATTPTPATGAKVLEQPGRFAWQVFDSRVSGLFAGTSIASPMRAG